VLENCPTLLRPVSEPEFDRLICRFGLFEDKPLVAVGVSGGADSLCLLLLLDVWLRRRGGQAVALIVDHQLRPTAQEEIQRLVGWLANYGVEHHILTWRDDKPRKKSQAAAREARYELLTGWCRRVGVLHLALAHHRDDQAETFMMRRTRGSGSDGLAGMPVISEQNNVRVLRPLLSLPGARLRATLRSMHQCWIEDPSNDDPAYGRTHVRRELARFSGEEQQSVHLAAAASDYARIRRDADEVTALLLVRVVQPDPTGFCWVDSKALEDAPTEVGLRALNQILLSISGNKYGPRRESLLLLYEAFQNNKFKRGRTLGGCYIGRGGGRCFVCREPAAARQVLCLRPGQCSIWDNRFYVILGRLGLGGQGKFEVRRLGADGWRTAKQQGSDVNEQGLPLFARYCLPALWDLEGLVAVPHLGYLRDARCTRKRGHFDANFRPRRAVAGPPFEGVDVLVAMKRNVK
ncbi:uncharacterized protein METZ01_LOCUS190447, partial [marine metagenome]